MTNDIMIAISEVGLVICITVSLPYFYIYFCLLGSSLSNLTSIEIAHISENTLSVQHNHKV